MKYINNVGLFGKNISIILVISVYLPEHFAVT